MSTLGMEGESMYPDEAVRASERHTRITTTKEPCPWCGCPGEQFDGHVCEDFEPLKSGLSSELLCGCQRICGDDGDIDGPGTCKGLPQPKPEPPVKIVLVDRRAR